MAAETTEGKRDEAEDASPKAELKKRRIIGWATAGISGLLFFMLQAHDGAVPHGALIGLLLVRAPNVRAALREYEEVASRGTLAAPSQQER